MRDDGNQKEAYLCEEFGLCEMLIHEFGRWEIAHHAFHLVSKTAVG